MTTLKHHMISLFVTALFVRCLFIVLPAILIVVDTTDVEGTIAGTSSDDADAVAPETLRLTGSSVLVA